MKIRYYIPYWFVWVTSKIVQHFKDPQPGSTWDKHFGGGYNKSAFMSFIVAVRKADPQTYWLMLIAPNGMVISLILLALSLIKLMVG